MISVGAFAGVYPDAFEDVFQRKRAAHFGCRPAKLAAASAAARDLNYSESRAMTDDRNFFDRRLHLFRNFDDSRQRRIALHDALEEIAEDAFDLAVDQIVDLELVQPVRLFQLPGARTAHHDLRSIFFDHRMRDDLDELVRVKRHQVFAEDLGVNVSRVGDAERVVRMNGDRPLSPDQRTSRGYCR